MSIHKVTLPIDRIHTILHSIIFCCRLATKLTYHSYYISSTQARKLRPLCIIQMKTNRRPYIQLASIKHINETQITSCVALALFLPHFYSTLRLLLILLYVGYIKLVSYKKRIGFRGVSGNNSRRPRKNSSANTAQADDVLSGCAGEVF